MASDRAPMTTGPWRSGWIGRRPLGLWPAGALLWLLGLAGAPAPAAGDAPPPPDLDYDPDATVAEDYRDPIRPFAGASYTYDSNFFRVSDDEEALRRIGSTDRAVSFEVFSAGVDADIPVSRQTLVLRSEVFYQLFNRFSDLDNLGFDVSPRLDWTIGDVCSGDVGYRIDRRLDEFTEFQAPVQNLVTRQRATVRPACFVDPRWRLRGEASWTDVTNSEEEREFVNFTEATGGFGIDYVSRAGNVAGVEAAITSGDYPERGAAIASVLDDGYIQTRAAAVVKWRYREWIAVAARAGFVHRDYDVVSDFTEFEGRLDVDYFLTAKTTLKAAVFQEVEPVRTQLANTKLVRGVSGGVVWMPTQKIEVGAGVRYWTQDFSLEDTTDREDDVFEANVGVSYEPLRILSLFAEFSARERTSNIADREFSTLIVSAGARVGF